MANPQKTPPTPEDINYLRAHPEVAPQFEKAFGPGSAAFYVQQDPAAAQEGAPESQRDAFDYAADITKGGVRGVLQAVDETSDFIAEGINKVTGAQIEPLNYADFIGAPETTAGSVTEGIAQFGAGFLGAGKLLKLKKLADLGWKGKAAAGAIKGAAADFVVFDPHQERLSNVIESFAPSTKDEWYTYLAADPDDSNAEGRFKNVIEGLGLGVAAEGVFYGLRAAKARLVGTPEQAIRAIDELPEEARVADSAAADGTGDVSVRSQDDALRGENGELVPREPKAEPAPHIPPVERSILDDITNEVVARDAVGADTTLPYRLDKHLETPAGALRLISAVTDRLVAEGERVPIKDIVKQAESLAFSLSLTPEALMRGISSSNDPGRLAAEVLARQKVLDLAGIRADRALNNFLDATGEAAKAAKVEYDRSVEELAVAAQAAGSSRSEAGRALRALRESGSPSEKLVQRVNKLPPERLRELRAMLLSVQDPVAKRKLMLEALAKPTPWETAVKVWRNSILSGPATHIVNAASNTFKLGNMYAEDFLAGVSKGDRLQAAAAAHGFVDAWSGLGDAFKAAGAAWKMGRGIIDPAAHSVDNPKAATSASRNLADLYASVQDGNIWKAHLIATRSLAGDFALRTLGASDELFKRIAYNSRIRSQAWAEGRAMDLSGKELSDFIDDRLRRSYDVRTGEGIDEDALAFAREATFTSDLTDETVIQTVGQKITRAASGRDGVSLFLQAIFPFIKTPTLVLDDFWQRSPLNLSLYREMASQDVEVAAKAKARFVLGATYTTMAMGLVASGNITGGGPSDPELRKMWKAGGPDGRGRQPYSVRVPGTNKWISYNRFDPSGTHFGVLADMAEIAAHIPDRDLSDLYKMMATAFARQFQNKTFLRGASDFFAALTDDSGNDQERWMTNVVASAVPAFFNAFKSDPYVREVRGVLDGLRNRIPGMSNNLDPQRDVLGRPVLASEIGGYSPVAVTSVKHDAVAAAIYEAFNATGETLSRPPRSRDGVDWTQYKVDRPDLGRRQSAYDRMGEIIQEQDLEGKLYAVISDKRYQEAGDLQKVEIIRATIGAVRNYAHKKVLQEAKNSKDPAYRALWDATIEAKKKTKGVNDFQRLLAPPQ